MIIIAVTDIHSHLEAIDRIADALQRADLVMLSGDLTHFGKEPEVKRIIDRIAAFNPNIQAVPGNCDYPEVSAYLSDRQINLHGCGKSVNGLGLIGLGGSLPCPGHTPNEFTENQLTTLLAQAESGLPAGKNPLILLAHQPPFMTLNDRVSENLHVGSKSVRRFIEDHQPLICFTGHIHEGVGIDTIGKTKIINPGPLRHGGYAWVELTDRIIRLEIRGLS